MKKISFCFYALLLIAVFGCGSDNENGVDTNTIENVEIIVHPQSRQNEIGVNQNITVTSTTKKVDDQRLVWSFKGGKTDKGFTYIGDTLSMFAQQLGKYTISLDIERNGNKKHVEKTIDVVPCDYRFAFFGADASEIIMNEESFSMVVYNKLSTPKMENLGKEIVFEDSTYPYTSHRYYLNSKNHLCRGLDKSIVKYAESRYNETESLFQHFVELVNSSYGVDKPKTISIKKSDGTSVQDIEFKDYTLKIGEFYQGYWYNATWDFNNVYVSCSAKSSQAGRIDYFVTYDSKIDENRW